MRLLLLLLLFGCSSLYAQDADTYNFDLRRYELQHTGMTALTTWAVANISTGSIGYFTSQEAESRYFHEMNVFWNTVNLGLGIAGLATTKRPHIGQSLEASLKEQKRIEGIFLINAGLDLLYMGGGLAMHLSADNSNNPERFRGYGSSLLLQGGFLFVFDGVKYLLHRKNRKNYLKNQRSHLSLHPQGLGLALRWNIASHNR